MAGLLTADHTALQGDIGATAPHTARRVEEVGYAALPGVVSARWLDSARSLATTVNRPDAQEVLLEDMTAGDGEAVDALLADPELAGFLESVATRLHPRSDPDDRHVDVSLRIINGPDEGEQPLWFHYDATVVTVVFPIEIPATGGELVLHANRRPFRRLVLTNIVEKMVMQSNAYRRRFHAGEPTAVSLVPGNAYVFSGYRSYHATLPCPVGTRRITLMVHYKDAHGGSKMLRGAKSLYHRVADA
jgi:hypothetical protein